MRFIAFAIALFLVSCNSTEKLAQKSTMGRLEASESTLSIIQETELKKHLSFIASDELRGRETGTHDIDVAAKYLAVHLESYGYKGLGKNGSFFQEFPIKSTSYDYQSLSLSYQGKELNVNIGEDLAVYGWGSENINVSAPLVSVGYGLKDQHYNPSEIKSLATVRFGFEGELAEKAKGDRSLDHRVIRNELFESTQTVIYVISDDARADELIKAYHGYASHERMALKNTDDKRVYLLMKASVFNQIQKLDKKKSVDKTKTTLFSGNLSLKLKATTKEIIAKNVVAILEGSDPILKKEIVGYGSHYDHDGVKNGEIYNGADDDGSGTVGVLNIAKALAANPPKRSTLINFHTAEEKGLFGSEYFSENPLVDLKELVAMINIDMIGSNHAVDTVHVVGADRMSQELHDINELMNSKVSKMALDYTYNAEDHPERIFYRSDHYNYAKKGIPVIFYTNDNPEDYHKPSDTVDRINFKKLARITRLALSTGHYIANKPERLKISKPLAVNTEQ